MPDVYVLLIILFELQSPPKMVSYNRPRVPNVFDLNCLIDHSEQVTTTGVYENTINLGITKSDCQILTSPSFLHA